MADRMFLLALIVVAGCSAKPTFTAVPVVQPLHPEVVETVKEVRVACVKRGDIPGEPRLIGDRLTGIAKYDIGPIEESARDLRQSLRRARELLLKCAGGER